MEEETFKKFLSFSEKNDHETLKNDHETLLTIIDHNPSLLHIYNKDGVGLIHYSFTYPYCKLFEELLKRGANIDAPFSTSFTKKTNLLISAVYNSRIDVIKYLLDNGANINYEETDGRNALCVAASYGYSSICLLLIRRGANIKFRNGQNLVSLYGKYIVHSPLFKLDFTKDIKCITKEYYWTCRRQLMNIMFNCFLLEKNRYKLKDAYLKVGLFDSEIEKLFRTPHERLKVIQSKVFYNIDLVRLIAAYL